MGMAPKAAEDLLGLSGLIGDMVTPLASADPRTPLFVIH